MELPHRLLWAEWRLLAYFTFWCCACVGILHYGISPSDLQLPENAVLYELIVIIWTSSLLIGVDVVCWPVSATSSWNVKEQHTLLLFCFYLLFRLSFPWYPNTCPIALFIQRQQSEHTNCAKSIPLRFNNAPLLWHCVSVCDKIQCFSLIKLLISLFHAENAGAYKIETDGMALNVFCNI